MPVRPTAVRGARAARPQAFGTAALLALLLAACSNTPKDQTANWTPERLYTEAKEEMSAGNYERAGTLFERLEGRATGTLLSQQAQLERAYVMYRTNEKAQALSILERFIKLHPTSPALDYALYLQGLVNFNDNLGLLGSLSRQDLSERDQQASRDSYQSFKQLVEQFPQSRYASDAQLRMNYIVNSLAAYEVHVARYYFRRGAYVASLNRAQAAVQDYQQSPSAEEALAIMVQSYDRLGMKDLRDDAQRVLDKNFPNSGYRSASSLGRSAPRAWWQFW
ncbi:outer membrane protein assembly factor BamD [Piscinibacter sakaiensis]|uniref:Outer membrane protein assembly factor BamD n=1 Tax=Piscinibacter sakaiensis TaxID=1547922 RepID=A0A0K8P6Z9_PISS1|nr:outer membrane protein assembly factor BamD [Piscinibacter sakaiensis]GAP38428.1 probable component of the lipoprotein assembly complex [Piscinibacter sakaiensis]